MKVQDVLKYMETRFPYELAENFDQGKIGLTIGNRNNEVTGILCSLDLTTQVIDEAVKKGCNLIITHHPVLFSPITKVLFDDDKGEIIYKMARNDISLIDMHTNMDLGFNGVADRLCDAYGLKNSNYGINEKDEFVRMGDIDEMTLEELCQKTKQIFGLNGVRVVGNKDTKIRKIAILGGSGGQENEILKAKQAGCDCYITGEIKHHIGIFANFYNICLIEVNHGIEKKVFEQLIKDLQNEFKDTKISYADFNTDFFYYM